jgi:hypothetical protein
MRANEQTIYTKETWEVIRQFALQQNRLNSEKNFVNNEQRRLETEKPKGWKKQYEELSKKYENERTAMKQVDSSIDFVSRAMGFLPVDVYNEMERHWQQDLTLEQKQGYSTF